MDHFVTIPVDEHGWIHDTRTGTNDISAALVSAMDDGKRFTDIFIYSHGWWTTADASMLQYGKFSLGYTQALIKIDNDLQYPPKSSFGLGLHWPSILSENTDSVTDKFQILSYYEMERRADLVGKNGLYSILKLILQEKSKSQRHPQVAFNWAQLRMQGFMQRLTQIVCKKQGRWPIKTIFSKITHKPSTATSSIPK